MSRWATEPPFDGQVMVDITYLYEGSSLDVDNVPKPILDALKGLVYSEMTIMRDFRASEHLLVHKTAQDYQRKGYEVTLDAPLDFLPGYRADVLARKGDEVRVIEVKTHSSMADDPRIVELAGILETKPNWSFELLWVGEPEKLRAPDGTRPFESEDISRRTEEARKALEAGFPEAALLLAWSALEASIRELLIADGVVAERVTKTGYLLDQAIFNGIMSNDDNDALAPYRKHRNAIVHGFDVDGFSGEMVTELIDLTRRIEVDAALALEEGYDC